MRIWLAYDEPGEGARADEIDVLAQAEAVERGLVHLGHDVERLLVGLDLARARTRLEQGAPELVFNLVESLGGAGRFIAYFPGLLEELGIAYTGCPHEALHASSSKTLARRRMAEAGLPVAPAWTREELLREPAAFRPDRYIVKSIWEHASLGLDESSIVAVESPRELLLAIDARRGSMGREAFAERFVDGREFNLSVLSAAGEPEVLPQAEIRFEGFEPERPRIVGYKAKWEETSFEYQHTQRVFDFPESDAPLLAELGFLSQRCWRLFGLRGWARVDFRVDAEGRPWILEVNANPCIAPDAGFSAALERAGIPFERALERILEDACGRDRPQRARNASTARAPRASRPLRQSPSPSDREAVRAIVASSGFFHDYEVEVAVELVDAHLEKGLASGYHFLFLDGPDGPLAYACYGPTPCTAGSWDLYWIAVHDSQRGRGLGSELLEAAERAMRAEGARSIWVETSSRPLYEPTRAFYRTSGYEEAALLRDFYAPGDGKVVFLKRLA